MKRWTKKEVKFLKKYYRKKLDKDLAISLEREIGSIKYMCLKLGLKKDYDFYCKSRKKYKQEFTKEIFKKLYTQNKKSIREIASILGLSKNTVDYYLKKYKIKKRNKSEAKKIRDLKYPPWRKGLSKESSKKIQEIAIKQKRTCTNKRKKQLKKIEEKFKKPINQLINDFYWKDNLNQEQIAKKLDISRDRIIFLMRQFQISKRLNYKYISSLKGKNHSQYGKKWEDYGVKKAILRKKKFSLRARKNMIQRLKDNKIPFSNTKIEKKIAKELTKRSFPFIHRYPIDKKFVCDFALPIFNIIIEADGDYWHANSKIYDKENLDLRQKRNLQRDIFKDKYLKKKGWKIFRFFESEINESVKKCVNKVQKEIVKQIKNPLDEL